jgi:inner membrane protein
MPVPGEFGTRLSRTIIKASRLSSSSCHKHWLILHSALMDPLTHITAGALASRAVADRFPVGRVALFCILAAIVPDLDSVVGLEPEEYLRHHRAFTHSLLGIAVLAMPLAGIGKLLLRQASFFSLYLLGYGVMLLQVYLDLATTFGTQILWPFNDRRFAYPGAFIIDPFLTLGLIALLLLSLRKKRRVLFGTIGVAVAVVYPLVNLGIGSWMEQRLERGLAARGVEFVGLQTTTDLLTPLYWKVIKDTGDSLAIGSVPLSLEIVEPSFEAYPKPSREMVESLERQESMFRTWFWFAQYPVISSFRQGRDDNTMEIVFSDLRFESRSPVAQRIIPDRRPPFTLTAIVDGKGRLLAYEYGDNGLVTLQKYLD